MVISVEENGTTFLYVIYAGQIEQYAFRNFYMYKMGPDGRPLGNVLFHTYLREQVEAFAAL